ncbi:hypothetical protein HYR69_03000 [Candidatus Sumerlaeota bacterium]|nr:hypothetical protein [Candidatus Sumerlaeota bacterium]
MKPQDLPKIIKQLGMSLSEFQRQLSYRNVHVSVASLSLYARGRRKPIFDRWEKIENATRKMGAQSKK